MELETIDGIFSVCKLHGLEDLVDVKMQDDFWFLGRTDEELSLVCRAQYAPGCVKEREDGFRALRIKGVLEFSQVGVIAGISAALAKQKVCIFVVSTYNTDTFLVRETQLERAREALTAAGYQIA